MKLLVRGCEAAAFFTTCFLIYIVWGRLNLWQYDIAGHMASAATFGRGLYHQYSDASFLGYVHDLFYPPLEDIILYLIRSLVSVDSETAAFSISFKVYCTLLIVGFFGALALLSRQIQSEPRKVFFWIISLWLCLADKTGSLNYQGAGFYDLFVIGLSTQILGFIFLIMYIDSFAAKRHWLIQTAYVFLILSSHMVIGLVCAALMFFNIVDAVARYKENGDEAKKQIFEIVKVGLGASGMAAYFWIPFVAHRSYLTSSLILGSYAVWPLVILLCGHLALKNYRGMLNTAIVLFALIVIGTQVQSGLLKDFGLTVPVFHYYRFGVLALWLGLFAFSLDESVSLEHPLIKFGKFVFPISFSAVVLFGFPIFPQNLNDRRFEPIKLEGEKEAMQVFDAFAEKTLSRNLVQTHFRSSDFALESALALESNLFTSNKGLYWESHRSNVLLSSYAATFFGLPVVLDYYHFMGASCEVKQCMFKTMIKEYGIRAMILDPTLADYNIRAEDKTCYINMFRNLSADSSESSTPLTFERHKFSFLKIRPELADGPLSSLENYRIRSHRPTFPGYFHDLFKARESYCKGDESAKFISVTEDSLKRHRTTLEELDSLSRIELKRLNFERISTGRYKINVDSDKESIFWIHLSYLPGLHLYDASGSELPLYEAFPGMVGRGRGTLTLVYEKTNAMYAGYVTSLLFALFFIAASIRSLTKFPLVRRKND